MTKTEAEEIVEKGPSFRLVKDEPETITGMVARSIKVASELGEAKGYLEAFSLAERLAEEARLVLKAYLRLPIGPDVEAIVMPEMEGLEEALAEFEKAKG